MKKNYTLDTHRICDPKVTVKITMEKLKSSWVWEEENISIYDIGNLDVFHEYVYCISSHVWRRNNWWKGLTKYQALASALMEFSERYSWYKFINQVNDSEWKTHNQITGPKINVEDLILTENDKAWFASIDFHEKIEYKWIEWFSITNNTIKMVPWYEHEFLTTNCLGAWNSIEEATIHAIYESIERHNYNIMMANLDAPRLIDIESISNEKIQELVWKIKSFGFEVYIMDCSFGFGIHTIGALIYNWVYQFVGHYAMNLHMWTHSNKDIAIIRALTEIIQNRATNLDNNKYNINMLTQDNFLSENNISPITAHYLRLFREKNIEIIDYKDLIDTDVNDMEEELNNIVDHLKNKWYEVVVIDITQKNINIACVRVVIPWLQPMIFELFDDLSSKDIRFSNYIRKISKLD